MTYTLQKKIEVLNFAKALKFTLSNVLGIFWCLLFVVVGLFFFFFRSVISVKMMQNAKMEMGCGELSADRDCIFNKPKVQIPS